MVSDTSTGNGKVVVNRSISLDGFTAGPGGAMDWIFDFMAPIEDEFPEIMAFVLPVLLGDGTRFFSSPGLARIDLEPLDSARSGAVTILRFRVRK